MPYVFNPFTQNLDYYQANSVSIGTTITSGTEGSVLFVGPSSVLSQDNTNFFWDDTNNRLGIGTAAPSYPLQVQKDAAGATTWATVKNATNFTGADVAAGFRVEATLSSAAKIGYIGLDRYFNTNGSLLVSTDAAGGINFSGDNNTQHLTILTGGDVGIGTATPEQKLSINATPVVGGNEGIRFSGYTVVTNKLSVGFSDTATRNHSSVQFGAYLTNTGGAGLFNAYISTSSTTSDDAPTERVTVTNAGDVGIGITAPLKLLHVLNTSAGGSIYPMLFTNQSSNAGTGVGIQFNPSALAAVDNYLGSILVTKLNATTNYQARMDFTVTDASGNPMTPLSVRGVNNGEVGINTTVPQGHLDAQGAAGEAGTLYLATKELTVVDNDQLGRINFNAPLESAGTDAILAGGAIWAEAEATFSATVNSTALVFGTATTSAAVERWRITSDGHFITGSDNGYDIGASGATRPRTAYLGTAVAVGTNPSTQGAVRLAHGGQVNSRDSANAADRQVISLGSGATNRLDIGESGIAGGITMETAGGTTIALNSGTRDVNVTIGSDTNANHFFSDAGLFGGVGAFGFGAAATAGTYIMVDPPAMTSAASTIKRVRINNNGAITTDAGVTTLAVTLMVDEPNLTLAGGASIDDAYSLYISGAPTEGTRNGALWVASGNSRFDSTISANGTITLGENASIALDPAGSADGKYTGITVAGTAGATLAFGDLCYLAAVDSRWELADADAVATSGDVMLGMCVLAAASDGSATTMLLQGIIRADTAFPALTISAQVYVGTTAGDIQVAQPSGTDDVIRVVGRALTADEIYFNPSEDYITHV